MKCKNLFLIKSGYLELCDAMLRHSVDEFACFKYLLGCRSFAFGNDKKLLDLIIDSYCNNEDLFLNIDFSKFD